MVTAAVVLGAAFAFWMIWATVTNPHPMGRSGARSVPAGTIAEPEPTVALSNDHRRAGIVNGVRPTDLTILEIATMLSRTIVPLLLAAGLSAPAMAEPPAMGGPKMLIHGNYCGPGNNAPLPPIDALDAACARHDACTPSRGVPSLSCNARLQRDADAISRDPRQPTDVRAMAGFIATGAAILEIADGPQSNSIVAANGVRQ